MTSLTRRSALALLPAAGFAAAASRSARAADKTLTIGVNLPMTGAAADTANLIRYGVKAAVDELNGRGGVAGYTLNLLVLDDATSTAGQYDPGQAATNARKMISDPGVIAAIGPMNSGSAKAMCPILSAAGLAIITPSATNPDMTDPKFAAVYRPGELVFFRTVTTDAYQGPSLANYFYDVLKLKSVCILDDSGAYGVGLADRFEAQARKRGLQVLARDRIDPKQADYSAVLSRFKALNPGALYMGGDQLAGVKVVKQSYEIIPNVVKGGGDGFYTPEILTGGGFPAAEGWYATIASPHVTEDSAIEPWVKSFTAIAGRAPSDYSITAYDGTMVIADAISRAAAAGSVTRATVRAAIQTAKVKTLQGEVSFDANGDLASRVVSVFQIHRNDAYPLGDAIHQFKYIGPAPEVT
jgi:branched-chain amino acid transport system substrate-binding protein